MSIISKITAKGQTTVPQEIRAALDSKPGDLIAWEVDPDGRVGVRRIQPADVEYLQAIQGTLSEWHTAEDEQAYGQL
jgi:antitoxin PrlF